jgi:hypothetical protein
MAGSRFLVIATEENQLIGIYRTREKAELQSANTSAYTEVIEVAVIESG